MIVALMLYGAWGALWAEDDGSSVETYGNPTGAVVAAGATPDVTPIKAVIEQAEGGAGFELVTVRGTVEEMGPTMGCWLVIRDDSGKEILVQTYPMEYIPQKVTGKEIKATGKVRYAKPLMNADGKRWTLFTPGIKVVDG